MLAHRKQVLRCAPEQVRLATSEERTLVGTPQAELLGLKDLIEGGAFKSQQYVDLLNQAYPAEQDPSRSPPSVNLSGDVPKSAGNSPSVEVSTSPMPSEPPGEEAGNTTADAEVPVDSGVVKEPDVLPSEPPPLVGPSNATPAEPVAESASSTYGPICRRVSGKDGPQSLWRPAALLHLDKRIL